MENTISKHWQYIRKQIIKRDKYKCVRCKKGKKKVTLTVHHIIPRSHGGKENESNLITLCSACHDYVECEGLLNRAQIIGSLHIDTKSERLKKIKHQDILTGDAMLDWHSWVYGGQRNPQFDNT